MPQSRWRLSSYVPLLGERPVELCRVAVATQLVATDARECSSVVGADCAVVVGCHRHFDEFSLRRSRTRCHRRQGGHSRAWHVVLPLSVATRRRTGECIRTLVMKHDIDSHAQGMRWIHQESTLSRDVVNVCSVLGSVGPILHQRRRRIVSSPPTAIRARAPGVGTGMQNTRYSPTSFPPISGSVSPGCDAHIQRALFVLTPGITPQG